MAEQVAKDVREAIIIESTRLFLANGFRGTSVKEITEAAGIARGTLYWYFPSKDDVLVTIFRRFESEFLDGLIAETDRCDGNFEDKYRAFVKYATEYARDNRQLSVAFTTLLGEMVGSNTDAEKVVRGIYERYHRFVERMLEDGKRDGSVSEDLDTSIYAHIIIASNSGMLLEWLVFGEALDSKAFVTKMRDVLLSGIGEKRK